MILRYFQRGFNYSQDGPGNRLVYHLQGCNMHCPWCSNPEGMDIYGKAAEKSCEEVTKEILSCAPMFFDSGGITFTGGEASLQSDAVYEIMKSVKDMGISTAIETNATNKNLKKLISVCDCWMIDFKHADGEKLKEITGADIKPIIDNISIISAQVSPHLRIPLIHGFNDSDCDLEKFIDFFSALKLSGGRFDIELLPYHEYGREKWRKCSKEYTVKDGFVSEATINKFKNAFKSGGFDLIHT